MASVEAKAWATLYARVLAGHGVFASLAWMGSLDRNPEARAADDRLRTLILALGPTLEVPENLSPIT